MKKERLEYFIVKLKMSINKDLYDKKIIDFDIFNNMQKKMIKKIDEEI